MPLAQNLQRFKKTYVLNVYINCIKIIKTIIFDQTSESLNVVI